MIFSSKAGPRWPGAVVGLVCAATLAVLAACGGGTSQYEVFTPKRLLVFGDEDSALTGNGHKYSVNGVDSNTNLFDCSANPLWVQSVASYYNFAFAQCNPGNAAEPQAFMYATPGAKVADITAQIEGQVAAGGFRDNDLTLLMAGANDILELYAGYPGQPESSLIEEARNRGRQMAQVVNRLAALGSKVIVSNLPDMGLTPFALAERSANTDTDRAALLTRITAAFNEQLGANVLLDGRYVGLMQTDVRTQAAERSPGSFSLTDVVTAICTEAPPNCTPSTLVSGATPASSLWSSPTHFAPGGQNMLATLALDRAQRNPF